MVFNRRIRVAVFACVLVGLFGIGGCLLHELVFAEPVTAAQTQADSAAGPSESRATIDITGAQVSHSETEECTESRITPDVTVVLDGRELQQGTDYTVAYSNNKKPGKANITITGAGNYSGTIERSFTITGTYRPIVLVPDTTLESAGKTRKYLKDNGIRSVYTKSASQVNIDDYDGLVIPGGTNDVDPSWYGEKNTGSKKPFIWFDRMQIRLIQKFAAAGKPVLGICRGAQVINVAFGGSLYQDLGGYHNGPQPTMVKEGSWLYRMFGSEYSTKHNHHQAIKKIGRGLVPTQWCTQDGVTIVEMVEGRDLPVWGLQFHPEYMGHAGDRIARKFRWECLRRVS